MKQSKKEYAARRALISLCMALVLALSGLPALARGEAIVGDQNAIVDESDATANAVDEINTGADESTETADETGSSPVEESSPPEPPVDQPETGGPGDPPSDLAEGDPQHSPGEGTESHPTLSLGEMPTNSVLPGERFSLAVPIVFMDQNQVYVSNGSAHTGQMIPHEQGASAARYDQAIAGLLALAELSLSTGAIADLPIDVSEATVTGRIVGDGVNNGYALIENLRVREDAAPGDYGLPVSIHWQTAALDAPQSITSFEILITIAQPELSARSVPWADGLIVYSYDELRRAITSGEYATIYLGYDETNGGVITYTDGLGIPVDHNLTIDGYDPMAGRAVRLVDYAGEAERQGLYANANGLTVTFRNLDATGQNLYGLLYGNGKSDIDLRYTNVTYAGRQMAHNAGANSTVSLTGCTVSITNVGSGSEHELAETTAITFYGANTITRTGPQDHAVIWIRGNGSHTITIAEGANVSIHTTDYLVFAEASTSTRLDVYGTLSVTTTGGRGSMTYADQVLDIVNVYGTLTIDHRNTAQPTLYVGNLYVSGTLNMTRTNSTLPLIAPASGGSITFDAPRLVQLTNGGGALIRSATGTASMTWNAQVINRHPTKSPLVVWNNPDMKNFAVQFTVTTSGANVNSVSGLSDGNRGAQVYGTVLQNGAIQFMSDTKLVLGPSKLRLNPVFTGNSIVSGRTDANAKVEIFEYWYEDGPGVIGYVQSAETNATGDGNFTTSLDQPVRDDESRVYALSNNGTLVSYTYTTPRETLQGPMFLEVPEQLPFETVSLSSEDQIAHRLRDDWSLSIFDGRTSGTGFMLTARVLSPLMSSSGDTLTGGLIYRKDGTTFALDAGEVLIARGDTSDGIDTYRIRWNANEGLLVKLPAFEGVPGEPYETTIVWTLTEGP